MDELFMVEKWLGEVHGVLYVSQSAEKDYIDESEVKYEKFPEPQVVVTKKKEGVEGEEEEQEEQPPVEEEEKKKPKFKPEEYRWTVTDREAKTLPMLFKELKGAQVLYEKKTVEKTPVREGIANVVDQFCSQLIAMSESNPRYLYRQIEVRAV